MYPALFREAFSFFFTIAQKNYRASEKPTKPQSTIKTTANEKKKRIIIGKKE